MAVLLRSPKFLGQLGAVNVGVELSYRAQHNHLKESPRALCFSGISWRIKRWFGILNGPVSESDCTHRHLHLEFILVELEEDVRESSLQEGGGSQNQNQLEVPREGALKQSIDRDSSGSSILNQLSATLQHNIFLFSHTSCFRPSVMWGLYDGVIWQQNSSSRPLRF